MPTYHFGDSAPDQRNYLVRDEHHAVVAHIEQVVFPGSFTATDAHGAGLATGRARPFGWWRAVDPAGGVLVRIRGLKRYAKVELPQRDVRATLTEPVIGKPWQVTTDDGTVLVSSVPDRDSGAFIARDSWLVTSDLTLPELIGVVELHRLKVKIARAR